jgi:hypothetical protein
MNVLYSEMIVISTSTSEKQQIEQHGPGIFSTSDETFKVVSSDSL